MYILKSKNKLNLKDFNYIFVYSLNYIGDTLFTTPIYEQIKKLNPNIKTTVVVGYKGGYNIVKDNPFIDKILSFKKPGIFYKFNLLKKSFNIDKPDIALILETSFESALLCYLHGIKYRIGLVSECRGPLLTHKTITKDEHIVDRYFANMFHFSDKVEPQNMSFYINDKDIKKSKFSNLKNEFTNIGIVPGTTNHKKKYSDENYIKLIKLLLSNERNQIYIIGGKDIQESALNICSRFSTKRVHNYANLTSSLSELGFVLDNMDFVIGSDTGPLHMANALGTSCIFLFGPTSHLITGPYNKERSLALYPKNKTLKKVNNINPSSIYKKFLELLKN
jgi:ADP-heptose:LPS heptosyltransferase